MLVLPIDSKLLYSQSKDVSFKNIKGVFIGMNINKINFNQILNNW